MKNKKIKWLVLLLCCYFLYLTEMEESYAQENTKVTVGFYEVDEKEQQAIGFLPKTGDKVQNTVLLISGVFILLFVTGMVSYKSLKNKERI
ncbi:LPXTG cell wall anchor domain-containing protein [Enterococcus haemoperoxidus]|uniref:LPXTG cell wall anchor domain-containing protein n=1 Tax=Enterococcus haemoperoxidus TaxID=155618 RepID=UPI00142FB46F|nr:LPXTG cell wall anchor domain-containing protein [Enterococcus haemoperoxidus]